MKNGRRGISSNKTNGELVSAYSTANHHDGNGRHQNPISGGHISNTTPMLSLSHLLGLLALTLFAYGPVVRLLGFGDGGWSSGSDTSPSSSSSSSSRRHHHHPRPQLNESLLALEEEPPSACPPYTYTVHIVSRRPLVLYLEGFVSAAERAHLLDLAGPAFEPSTVADDGGVRVDASVRVSDVAMVERTPTTRCVEARARALQGWRDEVWIERLRVQRYGVGGRYGHHFDCESVFESSLDIMDSED